jgi:hypothetical protein
MLTVDKTFDDCWLAADDEDDAGPLFCAQLFPAISGHQLVIGLVAPEYVVHTPRFMHLPVSLQTYSVFFWAEDPTSLGDEIMRSFRHCISPKFPIELVYLYGGSINNDPVRIALPIKGLH